MAVNTVNLIVSRLPHKTSLWAHLWRLFLIWLTEMERPTQRMGNTHVGGLDRRKMKKKFCIFLSACLLSADDLLLGYSCHCCCHALLISDPDSSIFQQILHTSGFPGIFPSHWYNTGVDKASSLMNWPSLFSVKIATVRLAICTVQAIKCIPS